MKSYELVVIFKDADKAALESEVEKIRKIIENNGGAIQGVDDWGKREIAFEIKKNRYGRYMNFRFDCDNSEVNDKIAALLRIADRVLKFQVHRLSEAERSFQGNPLLLKNPGARRAYNDDYDSADM